jgi:phosphoribosylanthranilate isomerase
MNIKVTGITEMKQLQQLDGLDIDFAGLLFYKESSRYVGDKLSKEELRNADFDIRKVGVFVNASYDEIMKTVEDFSLDIVQLHGDEPTTLCRKLSEEVEIIKAFRIDPNDQRSFDAIVKPFDEVCDYYLFDSSGHTETFGGQIRQFDWNRLNQSKIEKPFFLSGGIGPADVEKIKIFQHPDFYAVDINSKFEKSPGIKDMGAVLQFKQSLK